VIPFISIVGETNWLKMKQTCETAAAVFPHSLYCGIDLLVYPDLQRHAIIEINAFGDSNTRYSLSGNGYLYQ
jgi:hypothetical protein